MPVALQARGVSRSFRGFRALDGVDLTVEEGEIHAILGPNGAGKTTLFNCLSGVLQPTEGTVELFGEPITGLPPNQIVRKGLSRFFFQAEDGIRDLAVTGVQTCALPI